MPTIRGLIAAAALALAFLLFMAGVTKTQDIQRERSRQPSGHHHPGVPQHVQDWYKSVKNKQGVPCCDISDGHPTEAGIKDGDYWVPIDGIWVKVPREVVVYDPGNPTGDAVVWLVPGTKTIRCFVPGPLS